MYWHGFCDNSVTLCNVRVTSSMYIHGLITHNCMEVAEAVSIGVYKERICLNLIILYITIRESPDLLYIDQSNFGYYIPFYCL